MSQFTHPKGSFTSKSVFFKSVTWLLAVLTVCSIFVTFTACGKKGFMVTEIPDLRGFLTLKTEYDMTPQTSNEEFDENWTYEIVIGGKKYTGIHSLTYKSPYYKSNRDTFFVKDSGTFAIGRNGDVLYFSHKPTEEYSGEPKTEKECYDMAVEALAKYDSDGAYTLVETIDTTKAEKGSGHDLITRSMGIGCFSFHFCKMAGEIKTNAGAQVVVTFGGEVVSIYRHLGSSMSASDLKYLSGIVLDDEQLEHEIDEKIKSLVDPECDAEKVTWTVVDRFFSHLKNGKYALEYTIEVHYRQGEKDDDRSTVYLIKLL